MPQDLRIDRSDAGTFLRVEVSGTLNEALAPEHLADLGDGRPIRIDLEKVSRITSFGVRQWVRGLEALRQRCGGVVLERCSYACVSQLNLIATFSADALVASVMAPLRCEACEHEKLIVVDVTKGPPGSLEQPCAKCGAKADLEEDPETYFAFAKGQLANGRSALFQKLQAEQSNDGQASVHVDGDTKAKQDAAALAQHDAEARAKVEADARAKQDAAALAQRDAEARAKVEADAKEMQDAAARAQRDAEAREKVEAEAKAKREADAEASAKRDEEKKAKAASETQQKTQGGGLAIPPPPPADGGFDQFEATTVHFIEDVAEYMALPEAPANVEVVASSETGVAAEDTTAPRPIAGWWAPREGEGWWSRRTIAIAVASFVLGILVGFLVARL